MGIFTSGTAGIETQDHCIATLQVLSSNHYATRPHNWGKIKAVNKAIVDGRLRPSMQLTMNTWSLSLSKIWFESWLLLLWLSTVA